MRSETRIIQQAFRFELDPNRTQRVLLAKSVGASRLEDRHLRIPNVGRVRSKETCRERGFDGRVLSATITRRADRWFARRRART